MTDRFVFQSQSEVWKQTFIGCYRNLMKCSRIADVCLKCQKKDIRNFSVSYPLFLASVWVGNLIKKFLAMHKFSFCLMPSSEREEW